MSQEKKKERKPNSGQFKPGNEIGKETRFQEGNDMSSKYEEEYCERIIEYFKPRDDKRYPTFELFAVMELHVTPATMLRWCDEHPRFKAAYEIAKALQLGIIKEGTITKAYDSNFAKFLLINEHRMQEKVASDNVVRIVTATEIDEESD